MVRLLVASGVFAVAGFAGVAAAPAASATPLCEYVSVDTVATSPVAVGPTCVPFSGAAECESDDVGFTPWVDAVEQLCVPAP